MPFRFRFHSLLVIYVFPLILHAQFVSNPLKRELRGAWVATVSNIDWPLLGDYSPASQVTSLSTLFDSLSKARINAVFFQIRPSCDALYKSQLEPWSQWLTGTQGVAPSDTSYDPLKEAIRLARTYNLELHAWFNPYRAVVNTTSSSVATTHISVTHPEWILTFGTLKMLDPGLPAVREYVASVIMDVVSRYDIDGVHFDDYFYPYSGVTSEDSATYANYNPLGMTPEDWRRDNVNKLISMLNDSIHAAKSRVKFGVSPFGIWMNQSSNPLGSATAGTQSYSALYADTRRWLQEGWVDYMAPQVYWLRGYTIADYSILVPWWDQNSFSRHIYIGQATYRLFPSYNWPVYELIQQIALNRQQTNVYGSIHFSAKYFQRSAYASKQLNDSLRSLSYTHRVLLPTMAWRDSVPPAAPESLKIQKGSGYGLVSWNPSPTASDGEGATQYLLYRSYTLPIDFSDIRNAVFRGTSTNWVEDTRFNYPDEYVYVAATALDRHQNESAPSNIMGISPGGTVGTGGEQDLPVTFRLHQNFPNPFNPVTIIPFELGMQSPVSLRVYDVLGREVATLTDGVESAGYHQVQFDAGRLTSGTYFYRLVAEGKVMTKKMQVVK